MRMVFIDLGTVFECPSVDDAIIVRSVGWLSVEKVPAYTSCSESFRLCGMTGGERKCSREQSKGMLL